MAITANRILMLGIGGSGLRGLAYLLAQSGHAIIGADRVLPERMPFETVLISEDEAAHTLNDVDLVIYSDAIPDTHPVLAAARGKVKALPYQQALGLLAQDYEVIAVAGTHGKSSTTAFLAHILIEAGYDPTVLLGAKVTGWSGEHARLGSSSLFLVEADEYREHFLTLRPQTAIITNIEHDHPDAFSSLNEVQLAFAKFLQQVTGSVIGLQSLQAQHPALPWPADTLWVDAQGADTIASPIPGEHMRQNALLAKAAAGIYQVSARVADEALRSFPGLARRFEVVGRIGKAQVISDYAHHPTAIAATLEAARTAHPDSRIAVVFEAHMMERLRVFLSDFVTALSHADAVLIYPPFTPPGREVAADDLKVVYSLIRLLQKQGVPTQQLKQRSVLPEVMQKQAEESDLIIGMSAGNLDLDLRQILSA